MVGSALYALCWTQNISHAHSVYMLRRPLHVLQQHSQAPDLTNGRDLQCRDCCVFLFSPLLWGRHLQRGKSFRSQKACMKCKAWQLPAVCNINRNGTWDGAVVQQDAGIFSFRASVLFGAWPGQSIQSRAERAERLLSWSVFMTPQVHHPAVMAALL